MANRREFTRDQREAIVERSKNSAGQICCEGCNLVLGAKPYEIDHILAEGIRPAADKKQKLTAADGQLLGKECCHRGPDGKTAKDVKLIAEAKRRSAAHNGYSTQPASKLRSAPFPKTAKAAKREPKPSLPPRRLFGGSHV